MRGFAAHAVKKSLVWLSVVVFLLAGGCALRADAPLTPGELAGRAKAVEWELVTRSGERASPRRVADPRILSCLLGYLREARAGWPPGKENWSEYKLSFELRGGRKVQLKYVVRKFSRCDPGYLEFPQGWYEVPGQFNILVEALRGTLTRPETWIPGTRRSSGGTGGLWPFASTR